MGPHMISWKRIFILGIAAFGMALLVAFAVALGAILEASSWPIQEGGFVAKVVGGGAIWLFVLCGLGLLVPSFRHLYGAGNEGSIANRIVWTLFLILLPFVTSYFYFGQNLAKVRAAKL